MTSLVKPLFFLHIYWYMRQTHRGVRLGGTQTGSYQTGSYQKGRSIPAKPKSLYLLLFDTTPFMCLRRHWTPWPILISLHTIRCEIWRKIKEKHYIYSARLYASDCPFGGGAGGGGPHQII